MPAARALKVDPGAQATGAVQGVMNTPHERASLPGDQRCRSPQAASQLLANALTPATPASARERPLSRRRLRQGGTCRRSQLQGRRTRGTDRGADTTSERTAHRGTRTESTEGQCPTNPASRSTSHTRSTTKARTQTRHIGRSRSAARTAGIDRQRAREVPANIVRLSHRPASERRHLCDVVVTHLASRRLRRVLRPSEVVDRPRTHRARLAQSPGTHGAEEAPHAVAQRLRLTPATPGGVSEVTDRSGADATGVPEHLAMQGAVVTRDPREQRLRLRAGLGGHVDEVRDRASTERARLGQTLTTHPAEATDGASAQELRLSTTTLRSCGVVVDRVFLHAERGARSTRLGVPEVLNDLVAHPASGLPDHLTHLLMLRAGTHRPVLSVLCDSVVALSKAGVIRRSHTQQRIHEALTVSEVKHRGRIQALQDVREAMLKRRNNAITRASERTVGTASGVRAQDGVSQCSTPAASALAPEPFVSETKAFLDPVLQLAAPVDGRLDGLPFQDRVDKIIPATLKPGLDVIVPEARAPGVATTVRVARSLDDPGAALI